MTEENTYHGRNAVQGAGSAQGTGSLQDEGSAQDARSPQDAQATHGAQGEAVQDAAAPARMSVAAVVVTYNRCALLLKCIEHLRVQRLPRGVSLDVLVVDNASTDDTLYSLVEYIEDGAVRYYNTGANLGGAGGFAFGMRSAVEAGYDLVWVMDDDCMPDPDALATLIEAGREVGGPVGVSTDAGATYPTNSGSSIHAAGTDAGAGGVASSSGASSNGWGFLSSVVRWKDGSPCAMNIQRHPLFNNIDDFTPALQPCTLASFVSLLVPAAVIREVGLPCAEFFIWTDDWEFTRRISRRYPCYVAGESHVLHASATNNPGNIYTDPPERLDRYAYIYRNDVVLYREEGLRGIAFVWIRAAYHTLRVLLSDVSDKRRRIDLIWRGTREGFSFHPQIVFPS